MSNRSKKDEDKQELKTAPNDPRFQNQNQSYYCFTMYADYHRCSRLIGQEACQYFQDIYKVICPNAWISRWDQQIEDGNFPCRLPKKPDSNK